tara:strand:- start:113 stop:556 length:444 start_codon:yes stop_codon:yes gene_type:complete
MSIDISMDPRHMYIDKVACDETCDETQQSPHLFTLPHQTTNIGVLVIATVSPGAKGGALKVCGGALVCKLTGVTGNVTLVLRTGVVLDGVVHSGIGILIYVHEGRIGLGPIVEASVIHIDSFSLVVDSSNPGGDFQWLSTLVLQSII